MVIVNLEEGVVDVSVERVRMHGYLYPRKFDKLNAKQFPVSFTVSRCPLVQQVKLQET